MYNTVTFSVKLYKLILAVLLIIVLFWYCSTQKHPEDTVKVTTTKTVEVKKNIDSITVNDVYKTPQKQVLIALDTITKKAKKVTKTYTKKPTEKKIKANEVTKEVQLKNSKVKATIVSTGKVLSLDLKTISYDSIINLTTTKTITKYRTKNKFFLNYQYNHGLSNTYNFTGHELSVDYTVKNKIRFGLGVGTANFSTSIPQANFTNTEINNNNLYATFKIGIAL